MTSKHTPGPWTATAETNGSNTVVIFGADDRLVGTFKASILHGDARKNIRLVLAVPDLLAACETALTVIERPGASYKDTKQAVRQLEYAIAKARGEG